MSYRKHLMPSNIAPSAAYEATVVDSDTDTISRAKAIEALYHVDEYNGRSVEAIRKLPSEQPKRGKWIKISPANIYECSECGKSVMTNDICVYDFCHGCGAEMEVTT